MKRLPLLIAALLILAAASAGTAARSRADKMSAPSPADVAKADYLYLEALREKSRDNLDAAYELLLRAYQLNPADRETGLELSNYYLMMASAPSDSLEVSEGMRLLRDYWLENPDDYYVGVRYGLLAQRVLERQEIVKIWEKLHESFPLKSEISFQLADVLSRAGTEADRSRALSIFDSIEVVEGPSPQLSSSKIQLYLSRKDTLAAVREADRLLDSHPGNAEFAVFAGRIHTLIGDSAKALALFDRACELDPSSGLAYYSKAEYYNSRGDSAGFDREVFNALQQPGLDVETKLSILHGYIREIYTDSLQQPRITELFDTLVMQHPVEPDIRDFYARYLITIKDYDGAIEQEEQALGLEPDNSEGWDMLTSLYLQRERYKEGADAGRRAVRYFPDDMHKHLSLSTVYAQLEMDDSCITHLQRAKELCAPTDNVTMAQVLTMMGDNSYRHKDTDKAFEYYRQAIQYDPTNTLALNNLAYNMAVEGKDLNEALGYIERVMAVEKDNPVSLDTYAWVLFRRKEYAKAREIIDRAIEATPEDEVDPELMEHAGDIYFMDGEPDKALEYWQRALELDPDNDLLRRKVTNRAYYFK